MCTERDFKHVDYHVDSKALYALIDKFGVEDILTAYKGYATLVWTKPAEPGSLYLFHGASRKVRGEAAYEERPLYFMRTEEGMYFSSMDNSLAAIQDNDTQKIFDVDYNEVIKVTHGKFTSSRKKIHREDANLWVSVIKQETREVSYPTRQSQIGFPNRATTVDSIDAALRNTTSAGPRTSLVWKETLPPRGESAGRIFFHKGRYWLGTLLIQGEQYLNCKGYLENKEDHDTKAYYFWAGVLLSGEDAYKEIEKLSHEPKSWVNSNVQNFAYCISKFSSQPVTNLPADFNDPSEAKLNFWKFAWYEDAHRVNKNFSPKFSSRTYIINDAFLKSITSADKNDKKFFEEEEMENSSVPFLGCRVGNKSSKIFAARKREGQENFFDSIFEDMQEAIGSLEGIQRRAILCFCEEELKVKNPIDPIEEEIEAFYMDALSTAVRKGNTIREQLADETKTLEMYVTMIEEDDLKAAPKGNVTTEQQEEWEDSFYHKNGYYPGKLDNSVVNAETNFHEDDSHNSHQCEIVEDAIIVDDESLIDNSLESEIMMEKVDMLTDQLMMLDETGMELKAINTDVAQDIAQVILIGVDSIKHNLAEILVKHKLNDAAHSLGKKVKSSI